MDNNIGIIGGDLRIIRLAEMLAKEGKNIYTFALNKYEFLEKNILKCKEIMEVCDNCEYIISSIPFSKDGVYINAPFFSDRILIKYVLEKINNKMLIAGAIKEEIINECDKNNIRVIDLLEYEELSILNTIPTVEGAIQIAMQKTEKTIHNSKCLVLGFGRIGKLLSKTLKDLGAKVSCMARKKSDIAWINALGYNDLNINNLKKELENKYDIIFNTIPAVILDDEILENLSKETIIIELASKPGGIDLEAAKKYDIKIIDAQGLPGKVAPLTAAKYIKNIIDKL